MIDFIRANAVDEPGQIQRVREVAVVQEKMHAIHMRIGVKMVDAGRIKRARPTDDAVDFVTFFQQEVREVRAVLTGDACDECFLHELRVESWELRATGGVRMQFSSHTRITRMGKRRAPYRRRLSTLNTQLPAIAARCPAIKSAIPFFPSASIAASSTSEKVCSSPEPCSSTNCPSSVTLKKMAK